MFFAALFLSLPAMPTTAKMLPSPCKFTSFARRTTPNLLQKHHPQHRKKAESSYSVHRLNTSDPFVPPNPNEFESAYSIFAGSGLLGT